MGKLQESGKLEDRKESQEKLLSERFVVHMQGWRPLNAKNGVSCTSPDWLGQSFRPGTIAEAGHQRQNGSEWRWRRHTGQVDGVQHVCIELFFQSDLKPKKSCIQLLTGEKGERDQTTTEVR